MDHEASRASTQRSAAQIPTPGSVVGTIHSISGLREASRKPRPPIDFLEIRLDCLPLSVSRESLKKLPLPLLLTPRAKAEGGERDWSDEARLRQLSKFLPLAGLVDWELRLASQAPGLISQLQEQHIAWVASWHDFKRTPELPSLLRARDRAFSKGAKVFKAATFLRDVEDLQTLISLQDASQGMAVATMGMGPLGRASRLLLAKLGSVLNYGWLDRPQVPGQFPARLLRRRIQEL